MADHSFRLERDSTKDQTIVFIFIIATGGLLAWAIFKPWIEKWVEVCAALSLDSAPCWNSLSP